MFVAKLCKAWAIWLRLLKIDTTLQGHIMEGPRCQLTLEVKLAICF